MSTCETMMVTPEQAKILGKTASFELQRPMSETNVFRLRAEMDAGRFVPGTPIYLAVLPNKSMLALNGQHTLEAISRGDGEIELTFIYQDVRSAAEAGSIYARMDLHKVRSWRDSLRAYGAEDMLASSTIWTAAYAAALGQIFIRFDNAARRDRYHDLVLLQATRSRDLRVKVMRNFEGPAAMYVSAVGSAAGRNQVFKRAAVMGVGLEIMHYQPSAGAEFFQSLAADDGLRAGEPQRALIRFLRETKAVGAATRDVQSRAVALAWNAFFANRKLEVLHPKSMGDIRIAGTPWSRDDFDPVAEYLPELLKQKEAVPKLRKRKIAIGMDAATGKPEAIFA